MSYPPASVSSTVVNSWLSHEYHLPLEKFTIKLSELMIPFVPLARFATPHITFDRLRAVNIQSASVTWDVTYDVENVLSSAPTSESRAKLVQYLTDLTTHKITSPIDSDAESADEYTFSDKASNSAKRDFRSIIQDVKECVIWPEYLVQAQVIWSQMFLPLFLMTAVAPSKEGSSDKNQWNYAYAAWCHYRIIRSLRGKGSTDKVIKETSAFFGKIMIEIILPASEESDLKIGFTLDLPFIGKLIQSLSQSVLDHFAILVRDHSISLERLIELARTCFQARANLYATDTMGYVSQVEWFETVTTGGLMAPENFEVYCNEVQYITEEIKVKRSKDRQTKPILGVHVLSNTGAKLNYTCAADEQTDLKGTQKAIYDILKSKEDIYEYDLMSYDGTLLTETENPVLISAEEEPGKYILHHCVNTCTKQIAEKIAGGYPDAPLEFLTVRHSMVKEVKKVRGITVGSAPWAILLNACHIVLAALIHCVPECEDAFKGGDLAWQFEKRIHTDSWVFEHDLFTISTDLKSATDYGQFFCSKLVLLFVEQLKTELGAVYGLLQFCIEYYFGPRWLVVPTFDVSLKTHPDESIRKLYEKFAPLKGTRIPTARMWPMAEGMTKFMLFLSVLVCLRKTARETGSEYRADINGDDLIGLVLDLTFWSKLKANLEGLGLCISIKDTAVTDKRARNKYVYSEVFSSIARHRLATSCVAQRSYTATTAANIGLTFNRKVLTPGKKGGFSKIDFASSDYFGDPQGRFRSVSDMRALISQNRRDINSYNLFVLVNTMMSNIKFSTGLPFLPGEFCGNDMPYPLRASKETLASGVEWFVRAGGRIPTHERIELVRQHALWRKNVLRPFDKFRLLSDGKAVIIRNHLDALGLLPINKLHPATSKVISALKEMTPLLEVSNSDDFTNIFRAECLMKTGGVLSSRQVHAGVLAVDNTNKMRFGLGSHEEALEQCLDNLELAALRQQERLFDKLLNEADQKELVDLIKSHIAAPTDVRFFEGNVIFAKEDVELLLKDKLFCEFREPPDNDIELESDIFSDYTSGSDSDFSGDEEDANFRIPDEPDWTSPKIDVSGDVLDISEQIERIMSASDIASIYEIIGRFRIASDPAIYTIVHDYLTNRPDISSINVITADSSLFTRGLRRLNYKNQRSVELSKTHPSDIVNDFLCAFIMHFKRKTLNVKVLPDTYDVEAELILQFNQRAPIAWALLRLLEKDCALLLRGEEAHYLKNSVPDALWLPDWGSLKVIFWTTFLAHFDGDPFKRDVVYTFQCRSVVSNGSIKLNLTQREYDNRKELPVFVKLSRHFTVDNNGVLETVFQKEYVPIRVVPLCKNHLHSR